MAFHFLFQSLYHLSSTGSKNTANYSIPHSSTSFKFITKQRENRITSSTNNPFKRCIVSSSLRSKYVSPICCSSRDEFITHEDESSASFGVTQQSNEHEFNRVNCLVWVLHQSARSFSLAVQNLELSASLPALSNAWNGVDVNAWHKRAAYQVP
ncbi:hypothetical protein HanXRQr2_Chr16g0727001 [Helianthus annuus]|uniref:Uncharacterized protein n=1 Tax=Helianthus annuus TaxID=4232 RepID=A0A9K3DPA4_HELAN|nr:hypothetical protein HanXRQr2_Chr16g0727001 [Helianthus annuus]